ncbi:hypothetical protein BH10CHL1_BH10CHL1_49000 [soil metagenome]
MRYKTHLLIAGLLLGVTLYTTSCVMATRGAITAITIKGSDFHFEAPAKVQAGMVSITFENKGQEAHHMQLVQLKEGVTIDQLLAVLPKGDAAMLALLKDIDGGVGPIEPGGSGRVTVKLAPGNYVLLCFMPSHDGVPHLAKGMVAPLTVVGEMPKQQAEPVADGTVKLVNFSFVLPERIKAGAQTWMLSNEGTQPHEFALIKLAEGKTIDDLMAFNQNPHGAPPFQNVGGFQGIEPGKRGWLHLDLTPGVYVAICHIPDPASGKAHSELGMMMPFTVK